MSRMIATVFGLGFLRPAPGTWCSLAALPLAWALLVLAGPLLLIAALALAIGGGLWAIGHVIADSPDKDPSEIVVDELAGQWIALLPVGLGAWQVGAEPLALWPGWIAAFLLFRLFDIWKPGPIGWADRTGGRFGVMADDLLAGGFAALGVVVLAAAAHGIMLA